MRLAVAALQRTPHSAATQRGRVRRFGGRTMYSQKYARKIEHFSMVARVIIKAVGAGSAHCLALSTEGLVSTHSQSPCHRHHPPPPQAHIASSTHTSTAFPSAFSSTRSSQRAAYSRVR